MQNKILLSPVRKNIMYENVISANFLTQIIHNFHNLWNRRVRYFVIYVNVLA